jgi:RHS repeat-associated protein
VNNISTRYLLKDHLGSLDVVTDQAGAVMERLSFDAWGKRRQIDWQAYAPPASLYPWQGNPINRGYTAHEQLDPVGLIHMNGRVYDPEIGRFLSADTVIQDVTHSQALNGYSAACPGEGRGPQQPIVADRSLKVLRGCARGRDISSPVCSRRSATCSAP